MPINPIDLFDPGSFSNGLPDLSKISIGQIFNATVVNHHNSFEDNYQPSYLGVPEAPGKVTMIDPRTGMRTEVRKANPVEEVINGSIAERRGVREPAKTIRRSDVGGASPGSTGGAPPGKVGGAPVGEPPLPDETPVVPEGNTPSLPDKTDGGGPSTPLIPNVPPPVPEKTVSFYSLPYDIQQELKRYNLV